LNDLILKLVISLHSNPGVYALLLGSGVSRAAGIPTGWEIVLDLIRKIAKLEGESPEPSPETWYRQKFGEEPNYSKLLERLASTQSERNALLRSYFEPSDKDREEGRKMPTLAHKAIASLVKNGYIRIILTTNFDRLLESALEEQGISPDVISSEDSLKGAMPYIHSKCTIVKLHGDYRDTRIKNTPDEVAVYSDELNSLLDRILDEFGLIICGWSGEWDTALRNAILRCSSRRFTTFWAYKDKLTEEAKRLINYRRAETIKIEGADKFFSELLEKIEALRDMESQHPLSTPIAVATVKKYLSEERYRIRLHDFITDEIQKLCTELSSPRFDTKDETAITKEGFQKRIKQYEVLSQTLISVLTTLTYFDKGEYINYLTQAIERIAKPKYKEGYVILVNLQHYPALLILYACGITALASRHYEHLKAVLLDPMYRDNDGKHFWLEKLNVYEVFYGDVRKWVPRPNADREYTPASNYIFDVIRNPLYSYLPDEEEYKAFFDIFEYLLGLVYIDVVKLNNENNENPVWAPVGCFWWRYRHNWESSPVEEFVKYPYLLVQLGFFGRSEARFKRCRDTFNSFLQEIKR